MQGMRGIPCTHAALPLVLGVALGLVASGGDQGSCIQKCGIEHTVCFLLAWFCGFRFSGSSLAPPPPPPPPPTPRPGRAVPVGMDYFEFLKLYSNFDASGVQSDMGPREAGQMFQSLWKDLEPVKFQGIVNMFSEDGKKKILADLSSQIGEITIQTKDELLHYVRSLYLCSHGCGFSGLCERDVERHEVSCPRRDLSEVAPTPAACACID